jgi:hypothetical protein
MRRTQIFLGLRMAMSLNLLNGRLLRGFLLRLRGDPSSFRYCGMGKSGGGSAVGNAIEVALTGCD